MDQAVSIFHAEDGRLKDAPENMIDPLGGDI